MKRWEVTYCGKPFLLYANSPEEIRKEWSNCMDEGSDIQPYTNNSYQRMIDEIKSKSEFIGERLGKNQRDKREWYKLKCFCGDVIVRFAVDVTDGEYYTCCEYQVWECNRLIAPITWTMCEIEKFYHKIFNVGRMKYVEYSFRAYGQPKLTKPKELKGVKSIGSAIFIPNHCNPQIFIEGNDVWIKHTDYFSQMWRPPEGERLDMPISYYAKKYFEKTRTEKFIYSDGWGSIVLRNEAWLKLENLVPMCEYRELIRTQIAREILKQQKVVIRGMSDSVENEWERFWENVVKVVRGHLGIIE